MNLRRWLAIAGLLVVIAFVGACSSGSSTPTAAKTGGPKGPTTSPTSGSPSTKAKPSTSSGTSTSTDAYCTAARTYDSDLAHFSADDPTALQRALKDVTDLHKKAPQKIKSAYAVWLRVLQQVEAGGEQALDSLDTDSYRDAVNTITQYDHTHCGLPTY